MSSNTTKKVRKCRARGFAGHCLMDAHWISRGMLQDATRRRIERMEAEREERRRIMQEVRATCFVY